MRTIAYLAAIYILGIFVLTNCDKNDNKDENSPLKQEITGELIAKSNCKQFLKCALIEPIPDTISMVAYEFDQESNTLALTHINSGFNCAQDSLYCQFSLNGDTLIIKECEDNPIAYCNCLYDLNIEVHDIELKKYIVRFVEPYAENEVKIEFPMDLRISTEGSFSVSRYNYPWGASAAD